MPPAPVHLDTDHETRRSRGLAYKAGWALVVLVVLFLALDAGMKVAMAPLAVTATAELGFPPETTRGLGWLLTVITLLYAIPRTSVLGAVVLTGYLGGAIAVHLLRGSPWGSHLLFGVYVGVAAWGGLWLRDLTLRRVLPLRGPAAR